MVLYKNVKKKCGGPLKKIWWTPQNKNMVDSRWLNRVTDSWT